MAKDKVTINLNWYLRMDSSGSHANCNLKGTGNAAQRLGNALPVTFYRRECRTQTSQDAKLQVRSGEIWGKEARYSSILSVKAYVGTLNGRGIEFTTKIPPHPNQSPLEAHWYYPNTPGVMLRSKEVRIMQRSLRWSEICNLRKLDGYRVLISA